MDTEKDFNYWGSVAETFLTILTFFIVVMASMGLVFGLLYAFIVNITHPAVLVGIVIIIFAFVLSLILVKTGRGIEVR